MPITPLTKPASRKMAAISASEFMHGFRFDGGTVREIARSHNAQM
jgi:hypothetical protein